MPVMPAAMSAIPAETGIAVIGAGIIGAATALALAEAGHRVTVIDPAPGSGASFGNAGAIATGGVTPNATPGLVRRLPAMLFDRDGAGWVRRGDLPAALPWVLRMIAASRPARVARISAGLAALTTPALAAHRELAALAGCDALITPGSWLKVYGTAQGLAGTAPDRALMQRHGVGFEILDRGALARRLPTIRDGALHAGLDQPASGFVPDPGALCAAYLRAALARGAQIRKARVVAASAGADGVMLRTDAGDLHAGRAVICAGAASAPLAAAFGDRVPLLAERGYHACFAPGTESLLPGPTYFASLGLVLAPMREGLRLTMGAELARPGRPADFRRLRGRIAAARDLVPALADVPVTREWMGERPSLPDSLPVIGRASAASQVFYGFGHGHLGLTMAAVTAGAIRDLITGRQPGIDLTPYRADRFHLAR